MDNDTDDMVYVPPLPTLENSVVRWGDVRGAVDIDESDPSHLTKEEEIMLHAECDAADARRDYTKQRFNACLDCAKCYPWCRACAHLVATIEPYGICNLCQHLRQED